jgi:hypothetical protein
MGVHTGDSITVAPAQTLTDKVGAGAGRGLWGLDGRRAGSGRGGFGRGGAPPWGFEAWEAQRGLLLGPGPAPPANRRRRERDNGLNWARRRGALPKPDAPTSITPLPPAPTLPPPPQEYQRLRDASLAIIREMGVECGGSNVQMAVNPVDGGGGQAGALGRGGRRERGLLGGGGGFWGAGVLGEMAGTHSSSACFAPRACFAAAQTYQNGAPNPPTTSQNLFFASFSTQKF